MENREFGLGRRC